MDVHVELAAETLFKIGPIPVTNSMLTMFIVMALILLVGAAIARRARLVPGRGQSLIELIVEFLLGLVEGTAGRRAGRRIFPLVGGIFIFILFANYSGLLPGVGTIGTWHEEAAEAGTEAVAVDVEGGVPARVEAGEEAEREEVLRPFIRAANADLNMTVAMALIAVTTVQIMGIRFHGVGGYLKELATPWFLFPVHLISELSRILSLSARLFGNIFGGEVFLVVIFFLFPLLLPLIPLVLEVFFGFIQAVLFSVLTLVYLSMAAAGHGGHGDVHETTDHEPSPAHMGAAD